MLLLKIGQVNLVFTSIHDSQFGFKQAILDSTKVIPTTAGNRQTKSDTHEGRLLSAMKVVFSGGESCNQLDALHRMLMTGQNYKILAWPKFYSFMTSEIGFYVAIPIGQLMINYLIPSKVTSDPIDLAKDIYIADGQQGWIVITLNMIHKDQFGVKFSVFELGNLVKKLKLHGKELGKQLLLQKDMNLQALYKQIMEEGVKVSQGVNKSAVQEKIPAIIQGLPNKDLVKVALDAIKRLEQRHILEHDQSETKYEADLYQHLIAAWCGSTTNVVTCQVPSGQGKTVTMALLALLELDRLQSQEDFESLDISMEE